MFLARNDWLQSLQGYGEGSAGDPEDESKLTSAIQSLLDSTSQVKSNLSGSSKRAFRSNQTPYTNYNEDENLDRVGVRESEGHEVTPSHDHDGLTEEMTDLIEKLA